MSKAQKPSAVREDLPHNIDAEQNLFGWLLRKDDLIDVAAGLLQPEDFSDPLHQRMFQMMLALRAEGAVTPNILHSVMKTDPGVLTMDGIQKKQTRGEYQTYFDVLHDYAPGSQTVPESCKSILDASHRRRLILLGERLIAEGNETEQFGIAASKVAEEATDELAAILGETKTGQRWTAIRTEDALHSLCREIEEQATREKPLGISTGLPSLDHIIGSLFPGKFYVAGARPGMGKTILGTNLCRAAAMAGFQADFYSGEVDIKQISARLGCDIDFDRAVDERLEPLPYQNFDQLRATTGQLIRMAEATMRLQSFPGHIDVFDVGRLTIERIESTARRRFKADPTTRLIVVDHLQITYSEKQHFNRVAELSHITGRLKELSKELNSPVVALSQLNRDIEMREDKHPRMPDFRESGSIEQDADVMFGLMRPMRYAVDKIRSAKNEEQRVTAIREADEAKGVLELAVLKQRGGAEADYFKLFIDERASAIRNDPPGVMPVADLFGSGPIF